MKASPVLKKINGSYHRRLLPTEILQKGDRYLNGETVECNLGSQARFSAAYRGNIEHLWRPMPQIEGYRQLDLSDTLPPDGKLYSVTEQGNVMGPFDVSNCFAFFSSRPTVRAALRSASISFGGDILFYAKIEPQIAEGHNPDKLTEEQVGAGYRLLLPSEIISRPCNVEIEAWDGNLSRWFGKTLGGMNGDAPSLTYRVREGVVLVLAPAKAAPAVLSKGPFPLVKGMGPDRFPCLCFRPKDGWVRFYNEGMSNTNWAECGWTHWHHDQPTFPAAPDASAQTMEVGTNERLKKLEEAVEALKFALELQAKSFTVLQNRLIRGGQALQG